MRGQVEVKVEVERGAGEGKSQKAKAKSQSGGVGLVLMVPVGDDLNVFEMRLAALEKMLERETRGVPGGGKWQTARYWLEALRGASLVAVGEDMEAEEIKGSKVEGTEGTQGTKGGS